MSCTGFAWVFDKNDTLVNLPGVTNNARMCDAKIYYTVIIPAINSHYPGTSDFVFLAVAITIQSFLTYRSL